MPSLATLARSGSPNDTTCVGPRRCPRPQEDDAQQPSDDPQTEDRGEYRFRSNAVAEYLDERIVGLGEDRGIEDTGVGGDSLRRNGPDRAC
jgi:hypothetical protein